MKTKTLTILAACAAPLVTSCGVPFTVTIDTPANWDGKPNPLNEPGQSRDFTAHEIHAKNKAWITGNPVQR